MPVPGPDDAVQCYATESFPDHLFLDTFPEGIT
jgi:hypothetical protein